MEGPFQHILRNIEADEVMIRLRRKMSARHLDDIEAEFCFEMSRRTLIVGDCRAELFSEFGKKHRHCEIRGDRVTLLSEV